MIISVSYGKKKKTLDKIIKESNHILGIENEKENNVEYRGMLISYGKYAMRINTFMEEDVDMTFLSTIISNVFCGRNIGISGLKDKSLLPKIEGVNVYWLQETDIV